MSYVGFKFSMEHTGEFLVCKDHKDIWECLMISDEDSEDMYSIKKDDFKVRLNDGRITSMMKDNKKGPKIKLDL
jgi:hypothetical protein